MSKAQIKSILSREFIFYGAQTSEMQIEMWADELKGFDLQEITSAIGKHRKEARKYPPTPAEVISKIFGFPSADEAWSSIPTGEEQSVCWCEEMSEAYGDVYGLIRSGDHIAARMAFKDSYNRRVLESKAKMKKPTWTLSLGTDKEGQKIAIRQAYERGLLSAEKAVSYDPTLKLIETGGQKRLLLTSSREGGLPDHSEGGEVLTMEQRERNLTWIKQLRGILEKKDLKKFDNAEGENENKV